MEYMPYSGIAKGSQRGVFLPLLPVLLLFENLKLQVCELLLCFKICLLHCYQAFHQIEFAFT